MKVTEAFNARLSHGAYGEGPLRPLGTLLYVEALRSLDPSLKTSLPMALLDLQVVKSSVKFPPDEFPDHAPYDEANDLVIHERIASTG